LFLPPNSSKKAKNYPSIYQNTEFQVWKQERTQQVPGGYSSELPRISLIDEEDGDEENDQHLTLPNKKNESNKELGTPALRDQIKAFFPSFAPEEIQDFTERPSKPAETQRKSSAKRVPPAFIPKRLQNANNNVNPSQVPVQYIQKQNYMPIYEYPQAYTPVYVPVIIQPTPQIIPYVPMEKNNGQLLSGKLKFFDETQNYGFFVLDCDGSDLFVHYDELLLGGLTKEYIRMAKVTETKFLFRCVSYYGKYSLSHKAVNVQIMQDLNYMIQNQ
jgi:hypothetical protein